MRLFTFLTFVIHIFSTYAYYILQEKLLVVVGRVDSIGHIWYNFDLASRSSVYSVDLSAVMFLSVYRLFDFYYGYFVTNKNIFHTIFLS